MGAMHGRLDPDLVVQIERLTKSATALADTMEALLGARASSATAKDVIDANECAALLHCNTETVEELARNGELPGLKFGRGWIFVRADLLDFLGAKARDDAAERRRARAACFAVAQTARKGRSRSVPPPLPWVPGLPNGR